MSSSPVSTTEQDELIKYEYNLASCYEAEYLLSLKLQEEMMNGGSSTCSYDDGYEVQMRLTSRSEGYRGASASSTQIPKQELPPEGTEPMEMAISSHHPAAYSQFHTSAAAGPPPPPQADMIFTTNFFQQHSHLPYSTNCPSLLSQSAPILSSNGVVSDPEGIQNGYSLMEHDLSPHSEGPSKKRLRLQPDF